jgi:type I restriction enzyme S subunit
MSERCVSDEGLKVIRELPKNTLLVTCIASIGKNAILRKDGACNQQINAIVPDELNNVDFLYYLIEINNNLILSKAGITATLMVSKKIFSEISLCFPRSKKEQDEIASILSAMDTNIEQLESKKAKYQSIKQGMMQELLTGKTRLV